MKCHLDDLSEIFPSLHCHSILGDTSCHTNDINFLKRIVSDKSKWHLSGKANKRNAVIMRICQSCDRIGCSRTACHKTDTHFTGRLRITFCLMNQALLMSRQNQIDLIVLYNSSNKSVTVPPGYPKIVSTPLPQAFTNNFLPVISIIMISSYISPKLRSPRKIQNVSVNAASNVVATITLAVRTPSLFILFAIM